VIAGIDREFSYEKLRIAQRFILNGARFIATNRDATYPVADGVVPGAGAVVAAIEAASGVTPLTIGKPQALMPLLLLQKFGLAPEETAFVGDRLDTDMVSARRAGIASLFVATGISTLEAAERAKGQQKPDAMFNDLAELCAVMVDSEQEPSLNTDNLPGMDETAPGAIPLPAMTTAAQNGAPAMPHAGDEGAATPAPGAESLVLVTSSPKCTH
jgi:hypothetical protein